MRLAAVEGAGGPAGGLAAAEVALAAAEAERDALRAGLAAAEAARAELERALSAAETDRRDLTDALTRVANTLGEAASERDAALAAADRAAETLVAVSQDAAEMEVARDRLLDRIEAVAARGLNAIEALLQDAGVGLGAVAPHADGAQGGPFVPAEHGADDAARLDAALGGVERLAALHAAAERLPLAEPIPGARVSSGFGPRRDPFLGRPSRHEGVDFPARTGTQIKAPAEGVVSYVGAQRGYGRLVKIRHAFGVETVYAHLSAAKVRVGQRVRRGQPIAAVGNTGRSTGPHLHYEVRVDGRPVNPMKFIEAGRHVL